MRSILLAASENRWMRTNATKLPVFRKAVKRFMPGEQLEDALGAAQVLAQQDRIATVFTRLGENVTEMAEADAVTDHYVDAYGQIAQRHLDTQISVKLTQLGLDMDKARCRDHVRRLAARAAEAGSILYIDMEQHPYVDATLELYHAVLAEHRNVGVCLQSYLYRTEKDLQAIVAAGGAVRLVKGAYKEPESVAFPKKADVDASYLSLAKTMIGAEARAKGFRAVFGTHDTSIIAAIQQHAQATGVPRDGYEFALLYGIQRSVQLQLARDGYQLRVLISYGDYWFPWYMRRLAERPANVWFVARTMFS
ncbi:proline dehydrogenase family protein [Luteitalea sp.]|uniref:proline dehydrogenase family protein n=1 Tax=Luteitalea sp. TaxID=2004800 RepID=UPI0037CB2E75